MKTNLSPKQSKHLVSLGLLFPYNIVIHNGEMVKGYCNEEYPDPIGYYVKISIEDLLDIIPKEIDTKDGVFCLNMQMTNNICNVSYEHITHGAYKEYFESNELIDALYELTCWCIENEYLSIKENI